METSTSESIEAPTPEPIAIPEPKLEDDLDDIGLDDEFFIDDEEFDAQYNPPQDRTRLRFNPDFFKKTFTPRHMIPQPRRDPYRTDKDVVTDLNERRQMYSPEQALNDIFSMLDNRLKRGENALIKQAHQYLNWFLYPWIEGTAITLNMTPEAYVAALITNNMYLGVVMEQQGVQKIFRMGNVMGALSAFRMYSNLSDEEVMDSIPWWLERINETKPGLYRVVINSPKGTQWLTQSLISLFKLLKGIP